ncbi:PREDICTED: STE20-like serine/threonine-protein kinase [Polistes dominula]|uniref:STE20-like serine/threonine-protein kinase n=1 Tax=Polistes dominula TaxID=743375 RepID=A0ABM1I6Z0_POLDO|nr:PREDICTED: STE20-like serine/threonine-protein kinase [Polistes dominula]
MADLSDDSDINPEEIARIVEDIENLDNNLLKSSFKKPSRTRIDNENSTLASNTDTKKKVLFKDYNKEDPLADLISDEEEIPLQQKNVITQNAKSTLMESLFGIKTINSSVSSIQSSDKPILSLTDTSTDNINPVKSSLNQDSQLHLKDDPVVPENKPLKQINIQRTQSTSYINDSTTTSTHNKLKSTTDKSQKSLLMEDLFGSRQRSISTQNISTQKTVDSIGTKTNTEYTTDIIKEDNPVKSTTFGYAPTTSVSRESRRGRKTSSIINDPLGLLSSPQREYNSELKSKTAETVEDSNKNKSTNQDLPEWLGGTKKLDSKKQQEIEQPSMHNAEQNITQQKQPLENSQIQHNFNINKPIETDNSDMNNTAVRKEELPILISTQFDQYATIMTMQQQEHELRTAATLSHQNDQLNKLIETQKYKLTEQEKQFNMLIKKQMDRQILLEAQMKQQQERINHYIQTLIAQPTSLPIPINFSTNQTTEDMQEEKDKIIFEKSIEKLESEKLYLENTLKSLNDRHEYELIIHEDSYKRQITFLQETINKLEKKFRNEIEILQSDYESQIEKIKAEKIQIEMAYKEEIENLKKEHDKSIEEISERHTMNINLLQKEHSQTLENISKAKEREDLAVTSVTNLKSDMEQMLHKSNILINNIKTVHEKFKDKDEKVDKIKEEYLKSEKEYLEAERQSLERQKGILEEERKEIVESMKKLESKFVQFTSNIEKQSLQHNEAEERLNTKEKILTRERELFEQKVIWERKHLESLRDAWLKEQERQLGAIAQEREVVITERAKLEVFDRLKSDDMAKAELEAAIKTAQNANSRANQERLKWQEKIRELEIQQQQIQEKENELILRAKELENLTQSALKKKDEGIRALKQARQIEDQHKERLGQLQLQLEALAQRETKIASEKLHLARERLALRTSQTEKPVKDLKVNIHSTYEDIPTVLSEIPTSQVVPSYMEIIDPQLIMLKLNLDNQLDVTNKCLETMGI